MDGTPDGSFGSQDLEGHEGVAVGGHRGCGDAL